MVNGAAGISDIEGKTATGSGEQWSRRAAGDVDGQAESPEMCGSARVSRETNEFQCGGLNERPTAAACETEPGPKNNPR